MCLSCPEEQYKYSWYIVNKQYKYIWSAIYKDDNPHNLDNEALQIEKDIDNAQFNDMNAESIKLERTEKIKMINQISL